MCTRFPDLKTQGGGANVTGLPLLIFMGFVLQSQKLSYQELCLCSIQVNILVQEVV